jgi:hypothetical protein
MMNINRTIAVTAAKSVRIFVLKILLHRKTNNAINTGVDIVSIMAKIPSLIESLYF